MGAVVLADPGEDARTGSKRRFVLPALLVLGWGSLFAYSAAYLTEDLPFRAETVETPAAPAPKPLGRRVVMLDPAPPPGQQPGPDPAGAPPARPAELQ